MATAELTPARSDAHRTTTLLHVGGLHYASEKTVVEAALAHRPGVLDVDANRIGVGQRLVAGRSSHHAILAYVADLGPVRQARLGERLRVDHATFVAAMHELERRGVLRRGPDPTDRRTLVVELTPAGHELLRTVTEAVERIEDDTYAGLTRQPPTEFTQALAIVFRDVDGPPET